ncbi:diacylglycerol kinase family lipid kinase [Pontiellaceae bacterium B1224]|nr:diacylglycerol kinase family lipid kinase [Pontiellaceae bacterium B1224]
MHESLRNVHYIINPAGNGGAGLKGWETFKSLLDDPIDPEQVVFTTRMGHARELATSFTGCDTIVVAGGDGTVGEVISGIMDRPEPRPKLGIIPCGTGNDIARNAGVFSVADALAALSGRGSRDFDLIRIDRPDGDRTETRHSFLFANAGFSAIPMMKPWMKRMLGATGAYYLSTLLQVLVYHPPNMEVMADGKAYSGKLFLVIAGNAEYAGGGSMRIAPDAQTNDGELNLSIIRPAPKLKLITKLLSTIADGTYIKEPEVSYFKGRKISVNSTPPVPLDIDGELFGTTPATFTICPDALAICTP